VRSRNSDLGLQRPYCEESGGGTSYQLHLLFDKHFSEQVGLVGAIAQRIQLLGGITIAMAADVAETTMIPVRSGAILPPAGGPRTRLEINRTAAGLTAEAADYATIYC